MSASSARCRKRQVRLLRSLPTGFKAAWSRRLLRIDGDLNRQSEAINELRDYSQKTDESLQSLLVRIETLADTFNRKSEATAEPPKPTSYAAPAAAPIRPVFPAKIELGEAMDVRPPASPFPPRRPLPRPEISPDRNLKNSVSINPGTMAFVWRLWGEVF